MDTINSYTKSFSAKNTKPLFDIKSFNYIRDPQYAKYKTPES